MLFSTFATLFVASSALAAPVSHWKREVPQEHAHEDILRSLRPVLNLNNPDGIQDVVFGLLGKAAASTGAGKISDADCLQQATADQAFTNAKAKGDVAGMTAALQYRALERNTGSVGLASVKCTSIAAKNPEIAAIQQHQDPASAGAKDINKAIVLELAKQIAAIGGDPKDALKTGTFAPGQIGDPQAKGNTCDDANDANGCINTLKRLVLDATEEDIAAAVAGVSSGATSSAVATESATSTSTAVVDCPTAVTVTVTESAASETSTQASVTTSSAAAAAATTTQAAAAGGNLQKFTGAQGGISAPAVNVGGRGFVVANNSDFLNLSAALGRSCDVQHNKCADAANSGKGFTVGVCDTQNNACHALIQ